MNSHKKSFSLVELMVVIAIIGILAAIATPSYKTYVIKANIAAAIPIGEQAIKTLINTYETTGSFPSSLTVYGGTANGSTTTFIPVNTKYQIGYASNLNCTNGPCAVVEVFFATNIGVPNYSFVSGSGGTADRICMVLIYNTSANIHTRDCGSCSAIAPDIPPQYLPSGCNNPNLESKYGW